MRAVESFVAGTWVAGSGGRPVHDAVTGEMIASVSSDGVDLGALSQSRRDRFRAEQIGVIFQMFNLLPYASAVDNVILPIRFAPARSGSAE